MYMYLRDTRRCRAVGYLLKPSSTKLISPAIAKFLMYQCTLVHTYATTLTCQKFGCTVQYSYVLCTVQVYTTCKYRLYIAYPSPIHGCASVVISDHHSRKCSFTHTIKFSANYVGRLSIHQIALWAPGCQTLGSKVPLFSPYSVSTPRTFVNSDDAQSSFFLRVLI